MQSNKIYSHNANNNTKNKNDNSSVTSGSISSSTGGGNGNGTGVDSNIPIQPQQTKKQPPTDTTAGDNVYAIDLAYVRSKDILCILRSDLCIEFVRFMSRNKM